MRIQYVDMVVIAGARLMADAKLRPMPREGPVLVALELLFA
jgi:hypothetical protein